MPKPKYRARQVARGAGTINRLPSGRWRLRVVLADGRRVTYGVYDTEADAVKQSLKWLEDGLQPHQRPTPVVTDRGDNGIPTSPETLTGWFGRWQEDKAGRSSISGGGRGGAKTTMARDRAVWRRWKPWVGDLLLHEVALKADPKVPRRRDYPYIQSVLDSWDRARAKPGKETVADPKGKTWRLLHPNSLRTYAGVLCALTAFATREVNRGAEGRLAKDPLADWRVGVDPKEDRVRAIVVVDWEMYGELEQGFRAAGPIDELVWELLVATGCRRSEIAGLRRSSVNLKTRTIRVDRPLLDVEGELQQAARTKSGRSKEIPLSDRLVKLLTARLQVIDRDPDTPLLTAPTHWLDAHRARQEKALELRNAGKPLEEIAKALGYADPSGAAKAIRAAVVRAGATRAPKPGSLLRWNNYDERGFALVVEGAARRRAIALYREERQKGSSRAEARSEAEERYRYLCRFTPHHVRHLAAAVLWASGASDYEVAGILGHQDLETSRRLYRDWLPGVKADAVARAEAFRMEKVAAARQRDSA